MFWSAHTGKLVRCAPASVMTVKQLTPPRILPEEVVGSKMQHWTPLLLRLLPSIDRSKGRIATIAMKAIVVDMIGGFGTFQNL